MVDIPDVCRSLFDSFNDEDVRYCHWKSNEHLLEGLIGETDLDILVDRSSFVDAQRILLQSGYKRFQSAGFATHPAMETYLGFDEETGCLVHIHLHYRLVLGQSRVKGYRLPWEDEILNGRSFDEETEVYTADPAMELLLLLLRYSLKIRFRDHFLRAIGGTYFGSDARREYEWLVERVDTDDVVELAKELLTEEAARDFEKILGSEDFPSIGQLRRIKKSASEVLTIHEIYSPTESKLRGLVRDSKRVVRKVNRVLGYPRMSRRRVPHGGVLVVFVGPDGSGKSTLVDEIHGWLSWKLDVQTVYLGSGDGDVSLLRRPIVPLRKRHGGGAGSKNVESGSESSGGGLLSRFVSLGRIYRALTISREKNKRLRRAWRARNRGMVVLSDRYPQNQMMGYNDGPLLSQIADSDSRLLRYVAKRESVPYRNAERNQPDLVVKLDVSKEIALSRKPETDEKSLEKKIKAVRSMEFNDSEVITVDAEQELEEVVKEVKRAVWGVL